MRMTFNTNASSGERIPASSTRYFDRLATQRFFPARIILLRPSLATSESVYTIKGKACGPPARQRYESKPSDIVHTKYLCYKLTINESEACAYLQSVIQRASTRARLIACRRWSEDAPRICCAKCRPCWTSNRIAARPTKSVA